MLRNKTASRVLVCLMLLLPQAGWAAFSETSRRYASPRDLFNLLAQKFPVLNDKQKTGELGQACWMIGAKNANVIGAINPGVGTPASDQPVTGFVRWLGTCGNRLVDMQFEVLKSRPKALKLWTLYFPEDLARKYAGQLEKTPWSAVPQEERRRIVVHMIESLIGPAAVIRDLGLAEDMNALTETVLKALPDGNLNDAAKQAVLALMMREEFISY